MLGVFGKEKKNEKKVKVFIVVVNRDWAIGQQLPRKAVILKRDSI